MSDTLAILGIFYVIGYFVVQLDEPQDAARQQLRLTKLQYLESTCQIVNSCEAYSNARQACAVAGNFEQCIEIKRKGANFNGCTDRGGYAYLPKNHLPKRVQCQTRYLYPFSFRD